MTYSREYPTEPGFYWIKLPDGDEGIARVSMVPFHTHSVTGKVGWCLCCETPDGNLEPENMDGVEWAGPIEKPKPSESLKMPLHTENLLRLKCDNCGDVREFRDPEGYTTRAGGVIQAMALAGWEHCAPGPAAMGGGLTYCKKCNNEVRAKFGFPPVDDIEAQEKKRDKPVLGALPRTLCCLTCETAVEPVPGWKYVRCPHCGAIWAEAEAEKVKAGL